jgi:asparagine synthase (glutamine-hydrolysing)
MSYQDAVEQTKSALIEAVRIRLRADVPLAFCMSGGIDSNSLISIARNVLNHDVHGFTILNTDARYEEQSLVEQAVKEQGLKHTGVPLSQVEFIDNMQKLVTSHDGPVATISYYVHWQLMKAIAAEGYKVTISGTAADEIFTGYYDHHNLYLKEVYSDPALFQESLQDWESFQKNIVRNPYLQNPYLYIENENIRDHIYLNNEEFSSWFQGSWQEPFTETAFPTDLLRKRMLNEMFAEAVPVILHEDDLNAMYFSMENRSPFLDRKLFEFAYSIPSPFLIQKGLAKSVLRDAMRGIVPDTILDNKRKVGFNAPILELVDVNDKQTRAFLLDKSPIFDFIKRDKIENLLNQPELPNSFSKFLFYFINSKIFLENKH